MTRAGAPTITSTVRGLTLPVWVLLVGTFVNTVGSFIMLFLTLYLTQKGLSPYFAGLALGAWGVGRIVGAFIGGTIADRLGYRATMALSMLTTAVLLVGLIWAAGERNPWLVVAVTLVAASVGGVWRPPAQAMLTELTPTDRLVMVTAIYRLAFNAGMLVSPVLGAFLSRYSWDLLFWVEAASSALFGLLIVVALPKDGGSAATARSPAERDTEVVTEPPAEPAVQVTPAERTTADQATANQATADQATANQATAQGTAPTTEHPTADGAAGGRVSARRADRGYLRVVADRGFALFLVALLLNAVVYIQAPSVLSLHLNSLGYATAVFGALASLNALMVIGLEVPLTKVTQRFPPRAVVAVGMALTGFGLSLYSLQAGIAGFVLATVVWTMGEVVGSPSMFAYPGLVAPPELRGRYIAAATVASQAGYSIGPVVGTAIWAGLGGQVFWIVGVLSVVAIAAVLASARTRAGMPEAAPATA
jgi:MFS family permease